MQREQENSTITNPTITSTMADTKSALAFVLSTDDTAIYNVVESIRTSNDKAFTRWPPHINFIFPFVSSQNFDETKRILESEAIQKIINEIKSVGITFDEVSYFDQKKIVTFHLKPNKESHDLLEKLYVAVTTQINSKFPFCESKRKVFHPHLTLGQCLKTNWNNGFDRTIKEQFNFPTKVKFDGLTHLNRSQESNDRMTPC